MPERFKSYVSTSNASMQELVMRIGKVVSLMQPVSVRFGVQSKRATSSRAKLHRSKWKCPHAWLLLSAHLAVWAASGLWGCHARGATGCRPCVDIVLACMKFSLRAAGLKPNAGRYCCVSPLSGRWHPCPARVPASWTQPNCTATATSA